jgi:hypothetical protein
MRQALDHVASDSETSELKRWRARLMDYPIFKGRHILNMMEPFISLKAYGPGDVILAKGEPAQWVGWLIDGESMYTATYTFEDLREERTAIESQVMIGLVGTLFNLPSLIHHTARTTCVIAQVRKETFNQCLGTDTGPDPSLIEIIERLDFENSFDVTRECLRIETVFGYPWWHVFGASGLPLDDRTALARRILESSSFPGIITNLSRIIEGNAWTPIDFAAEKWGPRNCTDSHPLYGSNTPYHDQTRSTEWESKAS